MEETIATITFAGLVAFAAWLLLRILTSGPPPTPLKATVVVDGSNVMHWGGDASMMVLRRVVGALVQKDHTPIVLFDANVGWKLFDRYQDDAAMAAHLGLPSRQVFVVSKGEVADERILHLADELDLPVVSNDRFRDWSVHYPWVSDKGRTLRGEWAEGAVRWGPPRKRARPARKGRR